MSRLIIKSPGQAQAVVEQMYRNMEQRIASSPPGLCPVDMALNFLRLCHAQTCGKCVPCRIGLAQLADMIETVLDGESDDLMLQRIEDTARVIMDSADCAVGISAANLVLMGIKGFHDDYVEHVKHHRCLGSMSTPVPCVALCPAGVDIPGYIALIKNGNYTDAVRLIRKDNPFPVACAYICEHPCEARCRRSMVDNAINIRGLKRYAVDNAGDVPQPVPFPSTGKKVAVVGGGPGGLSAAYYLALMGHDVTLYEKRKHLGGMMRYGIPSYRLPREQLDREIDSILSLGIKVNTEVNIGKDISFADLRKDNDCLYISIGAHTDKKTGIPGEDSKGVISAVEMLRCIGDDEMPDFKGKNIAVIGGGNVAMDCTRSAVRLGANKVTCVYRRRIEDMTAMMDEVEGAMAEGAEVLPLMAPHHIEADGDGKAVALWVQPQMVGAIDSQFRPRPVKAQREPVKIPADVVIVAIGQGIESRGLEEYGVKIQVSGALEANNDTMLPDMEGVFAGGDCVTGPATVIRAIAAGKAAAANIDEYLGFRHEIHSHVSVPLPTFADLLPRGRVNESEREAFERKNDFKCIANCMSDEEARCEASRCLRCDAFGYGNFKGGRIEKW